ncbi:hypothetical protein FBU30_006837 [Linnemannia zychae]|nr:hypothetical protein FBU30_006837 [Linnemannia zychae]
MWRLELIGAKKALIGFSDVLVGVDEDAPVGGDVYVDVHVNVGGVENGLDDAVAPHGIAAASLAVAADSVVVSVYVVVVDDELPIYDPTLPVLVAFDAIVAAVSGVS